MKIKRLNDVIDSIAKIQNVEIVKPFEITEGNIIEGEINLTINAVKINFEVIIFAAYPLRNHESETIKFVNKNLIKFDHVMADGSICIHTYHHSDLSKKLIIDISSLFHWIHKYYLGNSKDANYEHIIVPASSFKELQRVYLFTDFDHLFLKEEYGTAEISQLTIGAYHSENVLTSIIQNFNSKGNVYSCKWSKNLKKLNANGSKAGLFIFIEAAPVINKRFALSNWLELRDYLSNEFLEELHKVEKKFTSEKQLGTNMPLFIGYKTIENQIHWQAVMLEVGRFPIHGEKVGKKYITKLNDQKIDWLLTRNCSYNYFFGRGRFGENITNKRILIIGLGAVGSMIGTALARGGCYNIDITDYDIKEPENVCRSEYFFATGLNNKVNELAKILNDISPFVEVNVLNYEMSETLNYILKSFYESDLGKSKSEEFLNTYDIIFDCSTDSDLMFILSKLNITSDIINLSITNHAKELVCGVKPNFYAFVIDQFENKLQNDTENLYNPTGCWSPTFKASYNDINMLVQIAIKNINLSYTKNLVLRNFVVKTYFERGLEIKIEQY